VIRKFVDLEMKINLTDYKVDVILKNLKKFANVEMEDKESSDIFQGLSIKDNLEFIERKLKNDMYYRNEMVMSII